MVYFSSSVAEKLEEEGINIEVIDLRTLVPLDEDTIINSIKKTGKVLIVHEAWKRGGYGAELSALISEKAFQYLDAPIKRVAAKNFPIPYCQTLEDEILPQLKDIEEAAIELVHY